MTKKIISLAIACLLFSFSYAFTYVFNGTGSWYDASKWQNGVIPSNYDYAANITINGNCTAGSGGGMEAFNNNYGILTISAGSTLTMNLGQTVFNMGTVYLYGTMNNSNSFYNFGGTVYLYGTWNNLGLGTLTGSSTSSINLMTGGAINGTTVFSNQGSSIMKGTGTIASSVSNEAQIAPGNSPGAITINGDYTANASAIHTIEIGGTAQTDYDRIVVSGNVILAGTLNVSLINGFSPTTAHDLTIISGNISGTFATVNIPPSYTLVYNTNSVVLSHVAVLPVNFVNLTAKKVQNQVLLNWEVTDEFQVDSYEVQASVDGRKFSVVGVVKAAGLTAYHFTGKAMAVSKAWYRIKSVDLDGHSKYSMIAMIDEPSRKMVHIQTIGSGIVSLLHPSAGPNAIISVYTTDGRLVAKIKPGANSDYTDIYRSLNGKGVYLVNYQDGNLNETVRFLN